MIFRFFISFLFFLGIHSFGYTQLVVEHITDTSLSFHPICSTCYLGYYPVEKNEFSFFSTNSILKKLNPATAYKVLLINDDDEVIDEKVFITQSRSSGNIIAYFNKYVNNSISASADANHSANFEDTIIKHIDLAKGSIDVCNYNTGRAPIVAALNNAVNRGVTVRYVAAANNGSNNFQLSSLSSSINVIQRPSSSNIMHNKFIVIDADSVFEAKVITGSVNHTSTSLIDDYNNLILIEDQSLAIAYQMEFEEMWGSNTSVPNTSNAKFGNAKTDNTPHTFNIGGKTVNLYFSPSDNTAANIALALATANTDLEFGIMTFTDNMLGTAVINRKQNGVDCKGIIENDFYPGSEYTALQNAGVSVVSHASIANIFHHKYAVVDATNSSSAPLLITGSHNWSNSSDTDYDENTLIIHDVTLANEYYEAFMTEFNGISGIEEKISSLEFEIYPNPGRERFNLNIPAGNYLLSILTLEGNIIIEMDFHNSNNAVTLNELTAGSYLVKVTNKTNKTSSYQKLIVY